VENERNNQPHSEGGDNSNTGATAQSSNLTTADATNGGNAGDVPSDEEGGNNVGDNPTAARNDQPVAEGGVDPRNLCQTVEMLLEEDVELEFPNMVMGQPLNLEQHKAKVKEVSEKAWFDRATQEGADLQNRELELGPSDKWRIKRSCASGCWLACFPSWLNGTDLPRDVFRDNIRLHMNWMPDHLPSAAMVEGELRFLAKIIFSGIHI
jgi:hypothetical protein